MRFDDMIDNGRFFKPIPWPKLKKRIDKHLKRSDKFIAKIESEKIRSSNNSKCIPSNATIRQEYVRCGKSNCSQVKHGPYYYAYWKDDKGKLRKKYIGKYPPAAKNTNKAKSSDMDHASSDTLTDLSN